MMKKFSGTMIVAAFLLVTATVAAPAFAKDAKESVSQVFNKVYEGKVLSISPTSLTAKVNGKNVTFTIDTKTEIKKGPIQVGNEVKVKTISKTSLVADTIKVEKKHGEHYGHDDHNDDEDEDHHENNGKGGRGNDDDKNHDKNDDKGGRRN